MIGIDKVTDIHSGSCLLDHYTFQLKSVCHIEYNGPWSFTEGNVIFRMEPCFAAFKVYILSERLICIL